MDGIATIQDIRKTAPNLEIYLMTGHPEPQNSLPTCRRERISQKAVGPKPVLGSDEKHTGRHSLGKHVQAMVHKALESLRLSRQQYDDMALKLKKRRGED
jgi:hypothetical protein